MNSETRGATARAALEMAHEAVRAVNRQIVLRADLPRAREPLTGLYRVHAHGVRRITGADLKHGAGLPLVGELQLEGAGGCIHPAGRMQLVWQRADPLPVGVTVFVA